MSVSGLVMGTGDPLGREIVHVSVSVVSRALALAALRTGPYMTSPGSGRPPPEAPVSLNRHIAASDAIRHGLILLVFIKHKGWLRRIISLSSGRSVLLP
jgi:hypothetical protein